MGHAEMGADGVYQTSDFYVAAWLLSNGLRIKGIDRHNPFKECKETAGEAISY
jgi:hypothetical protein